MFDNLTKSKIWKKWKDLSEKIATFNAKFILSILYFVVFFIPGFIVILFFDFLNIKSKDESNWHPNGGESQTMEDVRKQW